MTPDDLRATTPLRFLFAHDGADFPRLVSSCLLAAACWWTTVVFFLTLREWMHPIEALGLAALVGYGLASLVALRGLPAAERRARVGRVVLVGRDAAAILLLIAAYPLGEAVQGIARGLLGGPPGAAFELPAALLRASWEARPLATIAVLVVVLPALQELLFRGLVLPGLVRSLGVRRGLFVTSLLSSAAFLAVPAAPIELIAIGLTTFLWSLLLGWVRLRTDSLLAAVLLRCLMAAAWCAMTLGAVGPSGVGGLLVVGVVSTVAIVLGLRMLGRGAGRAIPAPTSRDSSASVEATTSRASEPGAGAPTRRFVFPWVGVAFGTGFLVAECVVVITGLLDSFAGGGVGLQLLASLLVYVVLGAALDLAAQALLPRRLARSLVLRALPILLVALVAEHRFGLFAVSAFAVAPVAGVFAWACRVPWARPLAGAMALSALVAALPDRGSASDNAPRTAARPGAPSFVVVVLDTMRRDHASLYGYARETTPHLDALARRGVRFDRAYSTTCWSLPSHASLFTGLDARGHGATFEHLHLDDGPPTLPEVLARSGWETAGFSANPYITGATGMARGFQSFVDAWRPYVMGRSLVALRLMALVDTSPQDKGGAALVEAVRSWHSRRDGSRPYLLFVNLMEAHAPYQDAQRRDAFTDPSLSARELESLGRESHDAQWLGGSVAPERVQATLDLLDGATLSADEYLGRILEVVGPEPHVLVVSDHGDLVGEHGLHGHMTSLYEPLLRIPMVMAGPSLPAGQVVDGAVSLTDVMPTLLALAGAPLPPSDGIDLGPALRGAPLPVDRPLLAEHDRNPELAMWAPNRTPAELAHLRARKAAVVAGTTKRVVAEDGTDVGFDLATDPGEARPSPGAATGLAVAVPSGPGVRTTPQALDPAQREALRALGYVQ